MCSRHEHGRPAGALDSTPPTGSLTSRKLRNGFMHQHGGGGGHASYNVMVAGVQFRSTAQPGPKVTTTKKKKHRTTSPGNTGASPRAYTLSTSVSDMAGRRDNATYQPSSEQSPAPLTHSCDLNPAASAGRGNGSSLVCRLGDKHLRGGSAFQAQRGQHRS